MFPRSNQISAVDKNLVLDLSKKHLALLHQKHDHYFSAITRNNMIGYEILFPLTLKFQRKNYHCL